ncbi:MAG: MipA/OmpV family protein [Pseudomonadota bacterium]
MKQLTALLPIAITLSAAAPITHAQDFLSEDGWVIGGGAAYQSTILKGGDDFILPLPYATYRKGRFSADISGVGFDIISNDTLAITAVGSIRDAALTGDDIAEEFATIERGLAVEAGVQSELSLGLISISAELLHDISGQHDGIAGQLEASTGMKIGQYLFNAGVGGAYRDEKVSLYEYGVKANEATDTLQAYAPGSNWTPYLQVSVARSLSERSMLIGSVTYEYISNEIFDSPLVDKDHSTGVFIAYLRKL